MTTDLHNRDVLFHTGLAAGGVGRMTGSAAGWLRPVDPGTLERLPADLRFKLAGHSLKSGDLERAGLLLDSIERDKGESVRLLERRAELADLAGRHDEARQLLEWRLEHRESATALVDLARHHLDFGDKTEADAICGRLLQTHSEQVQVQLLAADLARSQGDLETARAHIERTFDRFPENATGLIALASILFEEGDAAGARSHLDRALAATAERRTPNQCRAMANLFHRLGESARATLLRKQADDLDAEGLAGLAREVEQALDALSHVEPEELVTPDEESDFAPQVMIEPDAAVDLDPRVLESLRRDFGHQTLRPGQIGVIAQVMRGRDTLAVMPTGAGKSLTFQLPAMLLPGVTLVISPLIALMKDQFESLPAAVRSRSALINSTLSFEEMQDRLADVQTGKTKLVYIAPERFRDHLFLRALQNATISLAVIDEAHCINLWGSDFRPDYLFIPKALAELGDPPVLAVTATATPAMTRQIGAGLGRDLTEVRVSLFRPNLMYAVHKLRNREEKIQRLIDICRREQGSGIVYVGSRRDAESLAATLRDRGVHAIPYHAGLEKEIRAANQERFMTGRVRVVVATIAFGMGIDKADVRFIVHFTPPDSLEGYAQESGRAGRDGKPARCILLATNSDGTRLKTFARREEMKIDTLRTVYAVIKRQATGNWAIVDPRRLELAVAPEDDLGSPYERRIDPRVALGILEQAGLLIRHPDAPATYSVWTDGDLRKDRNAATTSEKRLSDWLARQPLPGTISTADACAHSGLTPFELDRVLFQRQDLSVRGGQRGIAVQLLAPPTDIARRMETLLDRARANADRRIDQMISYINGRQCRHSMLAAHLGERLEPCGASCDVCRGDGETARRRGGEIGTSGSAPRPRTATPEDALVVLRAAGSLPFPMGKTGLTKLLLGSAESRVREDRAPLFGALRELSKGDVERLIDRLVGHGYLHRDLDHEYKIITITRGGQSATLEDLAGVERPSRPPAPSIVAGSRQDLRYERLTEWRRRKIEEESVPGYVIATNATLTELAVDPPQTLSDLRQIRGFGPKRVEKYGEEILALLANEPA